MTFRKLGVVVCGVVLALGCRQDAPTTIQPDEPPTPNRTRPRPTASVETVPTEEKEVLSKGLEKYVKVTLRADGQLTFHTQKMANLAELTRTAKELSLVQPGIRAELSIEKAVAYRDVIKLIDALKLGGIVEIGFSAKEP